MTAALRKTLGLFSFDRNSRSYIRRHQGFGRVCEASVNVKVIQDTFENADISKMLNIYADVIMDLKKFEFESLNDQFNKPMNQNNTGNAPIEEQLIFIATGIFESGLYIHTIKKHPKGIQISLKGAFSVCKLVIRRIVSEICFC